MREGLWARFEDLFRGFGWDVVILKYGSLQQQAFAEAGRRDPEKPWIDQVSEDQLYSALVFPGRRRLAQAADARHRQ